MFSVFILNSRNIPPISPESVFLTQSNSLKMEIRTKIITFLHEIGIQTEARSLDGETFLPGLTLEANKVVYDPDKLLYAGDLLHEAGHLAVTTPDQRRVIGTENLEQPWPTDGEEIAAVLWSYAASVHLQLSPEVVFHPNGYKNQSEWLISSFTSGNYIGLPLLEWMGLSLTPEKAMSSGQKAFPEMIRWVREMN